MLIFRKDTKYILENTKFGYFCILENAKIGYLLICLFVLLVTRHPLLVTRHPSPVSAGVFGYKFSARLRCGGGGYFCGA